MGQLTVCSLPQDAVVMKDGHAITTSLAVADVFGKQHKNVLQAINSLDCPEEFGRLNFQPGSYLDANNQSRPMFDITKNGLTLLVMGFTGDKATQFKIAYIQRFDDMESALRKPVESPRPKVEMDEAEFWRMKAELAELKLEKAQLESTPKRRPFSEQEKAEMRRLKTLGLSCGAIAKQLGRKVESVESYFYRNR